MVTKKTKKKEADLSVYDNERLVSKHDKIQLANKPSGGWPKITQGTHLTVKTFEDGSTELVWDDEALTRDVQKALTDYENSVTVNTVKTTKRKKKNEA